MEYEIPLYNSWTCRSIEYNPGEGVRVAKIQVLDGERKTLLQGRHFMQEFGLITFD